MKSVIKLLFEFIKENHPLGNSIHREDVPLLVTNLGQRLSLPESDLDFSQNSIKILERKIVDYTGEKSIQQFSDETIIEFVREIAAYMGEVLVRNANGIWETQDTLWSNLIIFRGNIRLSKEGQARRIPSIAFNLGNIGASAVEGALIRGDPHLYKTYISALKRKVKEDLNSTKE